jgi:DNA-binding Lrp family transcriptional regulator
LPDATLDDLDKNILKMLLSDASISSRTIAERLDKSPTTILNRMKKLKEHFIKDEGLLLDSEALGYEWTVIIEVLVSKGKLIATEEEIAKLPNAIAVYDVTGQTDIIVIGKFRNRNEISLFTKTLLAMEYVDRTVSHMALNTVKEDFHFKAQLDLLDTEEREKKADRRADP